MRTPPLPTDFTHARVCKPFCEKYLTLPLMGVAMEVVVVLVLAYLAIEFYALYWRQRLEKEN